MRPRYQLMYIILYGPVDDIFLIFKHRPLRTMLGSYTREGLVPMSLSMTQLLAFITHME